MPTMQTLKNSRKPNGKPVAPSAHTPCDELPTPPPASEPPPAPNYSMAEALDMAIQREQEARRALEHAHVALIDAERETARLRVQLATRLGNVQ